MEPELATLADWEERLAEVGVSLRNVAGGTQSAPRIAPVHYGDDSPIVLVITTYALNAEGKRYVDWNDGHTAAKEVRRFFFTKDFRLVPAPAPSVPPSTWNPTDPLPATTMEEAVPLVEESRS